MEPTTIQSGPAEVIATGSVISFRNNPIAVTVGSPQAFLKFTFEILRDDANPGTRIETQQPDQSSLNLKLINFKQIGGVGTTAPMVVGRFQGRRLYLHVRVYALAGSDDFTLYYSFFKGEEVLAHG